jgi:uncharacterized protein involved in response to NO
MNPPVITLKASTPTRIQFKDIGREPFRIFFPAAVLAGIIGVMLWPLYFWGVVEFYPGQTHPRIMAFGLFGGFIFGFLGTAMPRMLSSHSFRTREIIPLLLIHTAMVFAFAASKMFWGHLLFLLLLAGFFGCIAVRVGQRKDIPPPGFVLVGLAFACVTAGTILALVEHVRELDASWVMLERLLLYQGFVLLPILGIGPFILPRFFGMPNRQDFPESLAPPAGWIRKAIIAFSTGTVIIGSFFIEIAGWHGTAYAVRFLATAVYLYLEMPIHRAPKAGSALGASIRIALAGVLAGFLTVAFFAGYRISLLHLSWVGGFAVLAFVVATRVVFGHSGNLSLLKGRNRWLIIAVGLMLFGMLTRMSGDFWPRVMVSHYVYGAIVWVAGVLLWAWYVLPKVLIADTED